MRNIEKISKIGAAERQLNSAIRLFFEKADMIAVHTLAGAATHVFIDIGNKRGIKSPIRGNDRIRSEYKKDFVDSLNKAQNFFKHAYRDPDKTLDFRPQGTIFLIFEGVIMHSLVTKKYTPETQVFYVWFFLKHPDLLLESAEKTRLVEALGKGVDPDDFSLMRDALKIVHKFPDIQNWLPRVKRKL